MRALIAGQAGFSGLGFFQHDYAKDLPV